MNEHPAIYALATHLKAAKHDGGTRTPLDIFSTLARVHAAEQQERGGRHPFRIRALGRALGLANDIVDLYIQRAQSSVTQSTRASFGVASHHSRKCRIVTENEFGQNKLVNL